MGSNRFSDLKLRNFTTGQEVSLKSLWADQHVAVIFFRRFGCVFCRLWAKELSEITPILRRHNIKMIGVGFEDIGAKEFINSKYFDGDIYITVEKDTYSKLGFKRLGYFGVLTSLVRKESREAVSKSKAMNLSMDIKGDGLQNGGALFFEKGGNVLELYIQEEAKASFSNYNILKLYNLEQEYKTSESSGDGKSCKGSALVTCQGV